MLISTFDLTQCTGYMLPIVLGDCTYNQRISYPCKRYFDMIKKNSGEVIMRCTRWNSLEDVKSLVMSRERDKKAIRRSWMCVDSPYPEWPDREIVSELLLTSG